jgi:spore coat protein JC
MWVYERRLQYPVKITKTCPTTAWLIISQYGGTLSASMRYLAQRYTMPITEVGGLLTDIGTEELAHMELICAMVYQLTKNLTIEQAKEAGFDAYYIDHTTALWPKAASALSFTAIELQSKGDAITDLTENHAAEQKTSWTVKTSTILIRNLIKKCSAVNYNLRE